MLRHDPRTEWIAGGCASWITDTLVAVPLLVAAAVIALLTGVPIWVALVAAGAVAWAATVVRRALRRQGDRPVRREPET